MKKCLPMIAFACCLVAGEDEISMAKCSREPMEEPIDDYNEYYDENQEGAPDAADQDQAWGRPIYAAPEYYIPSDEEREAMNPPKKERKGAAKSAMEREESYSASK